MNAKSQDSQSEKADRVTSGILLRAAQIVVVFVMLAIILFGAAGRLAWTWAWVFLAINLTAVFINGAFMLRKNRETIAERGRGKFTSDWDRVVSSLWSLAEYILLPLTAGLDARFGWTPEPGLPWHLAGAFVMLCGLQLSTWAMTTNAFFATTVRIQEERGHTVCRTGPYRFVRHPGYLGFVLLSISTAFVLGSWWALIPAVAAAGIMTVRTALEDRMLRADLPGYSEYAAQVRYRLLPGVW
jgi:protein-S-isoprenylcysteine O-methyltransferase Ste14